MSNLTFSQFYGDQTEQALEDMVRNWLLGYAWAEQSQQDKVAVVNCIMAQGEWKLMDIVADRYASAQWSPGPTAFDDGVGFALSSLYECHRGPHTQDCPS